MKSNVSADYYIVGAISSIDSQIYIRQIRAYFVTAGFTDVNMIRNLRSLSVF